MNAEPGRGKFVGQAAEVRPSVWHRTAGRVHREILYSLGGLTRLEGAIASGQLIPCPVIAPVDTFWTWSVVYQQDQMSSSLSSFRSRPWTVDYRKLDYQRRPESHALAVPEVQRLIRGENISHFSCDIAGIRGISTLKSMDHDIRDIDEFPLLRYRELAEPVTEKHLQKNMCHWELRLGRMLFVEYPQAERRFYWLNDGDSHCFGAARYQVCRLGIAVPLTGRLCRYGVNVPMISAIRQQWHLFAVPTDELFNSFFDAMNASECPSGNSGLPYHMRDTNESGIVLKLVWLERDRLRANAVANALSVTGFPDLGKQLQQLTKEPSLR